MTKKRMTELISGYKRYAKDIIKSRGHSVRNYRLMQADVEDLRSGVRAGDGHPIVDDNAVTYWQRIPSLDFDKDSHVYFYCCDYSSPVAYRYVIINAITNEEKPRLIIVRYDYSGG